MEIRSADGRKLPTKKRDEPNNHLEQMEDKKNDHLERMEDKKNDEAEKDRAFQREITDKLLAHAIGRKQPLAFKPTEHGIEFQFGGLVTDQAAPTTVRKTRKQSRERAPTNKKLAA